MVFTILFINDLLDEILVLGGYNPVNNKAEILNKNQKAWQKVADYPYVKGFKKLDLSFS